MFKVGDKIRIRKNCHFYDWYSEEVYTIINIKKDIATLDRCLKNTIWDDDPEINLCYIIHSFLYERELKINKLKDAIQQKRHNTIS